MNKIINIKCPNCASEVHYDGIKEQFICKHCHHEFKINDVKNTNYNSQKKINNCIKIQEYYCNNCGAKIISGKTSLTTQCIYCKSNVIIKEKLDNNYPIDKLIPFKYDKSSFAKKVSELSYLRNPFNENLIEYLYVPYWGLSFINDTQIVAFNNNEKIEKNIKLTYENIPYDASIKFPNDPMQRILPFNFSKSIEFSPEYLSGNLAEIADAIPNTFELKAKYQIDLDSEKLLKTELKNQYPNLRIINYKKNTKLLDKTHVLLPIIYYSNGDDLIVMNGQTGNFYTNFPRVKEKKVKKKSKIILDITLILIIVLISILFLFLKIFFILLPLFTMLFIIKFIFIINHSKYKRLNINEYITKKEDL